MRVLLISVLAALSASVSAGPDCVLKSSSPGRAVCNGRGTLNHPHTRTYAGPQQIVNSVADCARFMTNAYPRKSLIDYNYSGPGMFAYNETSKICQILTGDPEDYGYKADKTSDLVVYQIHCYKCQLDCPLPAHENPILNPGFELSHRDFGPWPFPGLELMHNYTGPWSFGGVDPVKGTLYSPGSNSQTALYLNRGVSQWYQLCNGHYLLSFDVRPEYNDPKKLKRTLQASPVALKQSLTYRRKLFFQQAEYQTVVQSFTYNMYEDGNPLLNIFTNGRIPYFLDNIAVQPISTPLAVKPDAKELVMNGGFETGSIAPWILESSHPNVSSYSVVKPGLNSTYALQWRFSEIHPLTVRFKARQKLKVVAGAWYVASFQVLAPETRPQMNLLIINGPHNFAKSEWRVEAIRKSKTTTIERLFKADFDEVEIAIEVLPPYDIHKKHSIYLDNISIKEAPQVALL